MDELDPASRSTDPPLSGTNVPLDPDTVIVHRLLANPVTGQALAAAFLIASVASPLLKGILAGLAIAGTAAAVRNALGM